jgi:sugar lactone lactonase YvrE
MMRSSRAAGAVASAFVACLSMVALSGQSAVAPTNDLPNPYQTIENYFKLPAGRTWGSTSAIDVDKDGTSIWVAERCGANSCAGSTLDPILKFDASGTLVRSFGGGMFLFPHGIHVDRDGNIWVTDGQGPDGKDPRRDGKGHTVVKFSPEGKVLMTLGKAGVKGAPPAALDEPNDVITMPNGDILVAEGHGGQNPDAAPGTTARLSRFTKDGKFISSTGKLGSGPGEFRTPHSLALDSRGRLFVADRGNVRLQIFDQNLKFLEEWKQFSRLSGIYIDRNDVLYGVDSESSPANHPGGWRRGMRIGSTKDGKVQYFIPDPEKNPTGTSAAEGVVADNAGNLYGAEVGPRAVKKYVKK